MTAAAIGVAVEPAMANCRVTTTSGKQCTNRDLGRGFCHVHSPDGAYMRQHPDVRERWLARPDVQAILAGTDIVANHCPTCSCLTSIEAAGARRGST